MGVQLPQPVEPTVSRIRQVEVDHRGRNRHAAHRRQRYPHPLLQLSTKLTLRKRNDKKESQQCSGPDGNRFTQLELFRPEHTGTQPRKEGQKPGSHP